MLPVEERVKVGASPPPKRFITLSRMRKLKLLSTRTEDAWVVIVVPLAGHPATIVVVTANVPAAALTRLLTSPAE